MEAEPALNDHSLTRSAHCRRRKIRCVAADGDSQQRCQNCIRLKKECVFYPVDQQAAIENRSESSGGRPVPGSGPSSVVSSSPPNAAERMLGATHEFSGFAAVPSNAPGSYDGLPLEPGSALHGQGTPRFAAPPALASNDRRVGPFARPNDTYLAENGTRSWSSSVMVDGPGSRLQAGATEGPSPIFPRYANSPSIGADYAPYPTSESIRTQGHFQSAQGFGFPQNSDGLLWQQPPPLRTMSYGQIDQLHHHAASYQPTFAPSQRSHLPNMQYPLHPLDVQTPSVMQDMRGPQSAPVGTQGAQPLYGGHTNPFAFQQPHDHIDNAALSRAQTYPTGWYPEHSTYSSLAEESEDYGGAESRPG